MSNDQIAYWNGPAVERWVREQAILDEMLRPFGDAALDAARVTPDEAVVDVGCGCGDTVATFYRTPQGAVPFPAVVWIVTAENAAKDRAP
jgi:hypothetical protein